MGICATVKDLAEAIEKSKLDVHAQHRHQIEILSDMQRYADARDLGNWESTFQSTLDELDDQSEVGLLLWEIFELGRFNLYAAFNPVGTQYEYETLKKLLLQHGVRIDTVHSNDDW